MSQEQTQKIEALKEDVVKYSSRIHITAAALIAIGIIGACVSVFKGFNARHTAQFRLSKGNTTSGSGGFKVEENAPEPEFVSAEMFNLVDGIRIVSFLSFVLSMLVASLGKTGLRSTFKLKSNSSNRIFKKSIVKIIMIVCLGCATRHYVKENKAIIQNHNQLN